MYIHVLIFFYKLNLLLIKAKNNRLRIVSLKELINEKDTFIIICIYFLLSNQ